MSPHDIIFWRDGKFGCHRFYEVESVHLGAEGQASVIALKPLNEKPARDIDGKVLDVMYVPEPLLRGAAIYTREVA